MSLAIKKSIQIREISLQQSMEGAHFFNSTPYLLNKQFQVRGWQLFGDQPMAQIFFYIKEDVAISGYQSTFGSFDFSTLLSEQELNWFICALIQQLELLKVKTIEIKGFPNYWENSKLIHKVLVGNGFIESTSEINQHIPITHLTYNQVAKRNEIKKIKQCIKMGFEFFRVELDSLPDIYQLIRKTRERKNYSTSMTFEALESTIKHNPANYLLFVVKDKERVIATSVTVVVNKNILYNFYHADDEAYRKYSPLAYLVNNIYNYGYENEYKVLDLGTSSLDGVLNEGLFNFKKNLGAQPAAKHTYLLTI